MIPQLNKQIANAIDGTWQTCADDFELNIGRPAIRCEILELILDYLPRNAEKDECKAWEGMSSNDKYTAVQQFFGWDSYLTKRCLKCKSEPDCPYLEIP